MSVPAGPTGPAVHHYDLAIETLHAGNYEAAITQLWVALLHYPLESTLYSLLGVAYFDIGELYLARRCANNALDLDRTNEAAHILDKALIEAKYDDSEDDDMDSGPEPNSCVPKCPKDPAPTFGDALNPYEIRIPIP